MTPSTVKRTARRLGIGTAVAGIATATAIAAATPALAWSSYIGSNSGGANLRPCPYVSTSCSPIAWMPNGTGVNMLCWIDSQWVYPPNSDYASPRWFRLSTPYGTGYTHSSLVENQTSVGHC